MTYILLFALSPWLIHFADRCHPLMTILLSGTVYFAAYLFRFQFPVIMPTPVADWIWQQAILLGTSQFGYMVGMICRKERLFTRLRGYLQSEGENAGGKIRMLKVSIWVLPIAAFVGHCVVQSLIVAPITAGTVLLWLFTVQLPDWLDRLLLLMGKHSTNIWLSHMFFYFTLFNGLVFYAKYPLFIFMLMMVICLGVSYMVNALYRLVCTLLERYLRKNYD